MNDTSGFDCNGDGKINIYDDMLELHNAKQSMKNEHGLPFEKNDDGGMELSAYGGSSHISLLSIVTAILLGLLATGWVRTKVDLKTPLVNKN